jgi:hypothetical protein
MPRCTPSLPPPLVIDAALRALPLRIPTEVVWLRVLATPPEDAGSVYVDHDIADPHHQARGRRPEKRGHSRCPRCAATAV